MCASVSVFSAPLTASSSASHIPCLPQLPDIHGRYAIRHWQLIAALCAHFRPSSKYFNYIRSCLHHGAQNREQPEIMRQCANYCLAKLQKHATLPSISDECTPPSCCIAALNVSLLCSSFFKGGRGGDWLKERKKERKKGTVISCALSCCFSCLRFDLCSDARDCERRWVFGDGRQQDGAEPCEFVV